MCLLFMIYSRIFIVYIFYTPAAYIALLRPFLRSAEYVMHLIYVMSVLRLV